MNTYESEIVEGNRVVTRAGRVFKNYGEDGGTVARVANAFAATMNNREAVVISRDEYTSKDDVSAVDLTEADTDSTEANTNEGDK